MLKSGDWVKFLGESSNIWSEINAVLTHGDLYQVVKAYTPTGHMVKYDDGKSRFFIHIPKLDPYTAFVYFREDELEFVEAGSISDEVFNRHP